MHCLVILRELGGRLATHRRSRYVRGHQTASKGVEYRALVTSSRARVQKVLRTEARRARVAGVSMVLRDAGLYAKIACYRWLAYHQAVLRGRPRFLGVSFLSTICARMSMDSARYVAFSRGLLGEVGTPWP